MLILSVEISCLYISMPHKGINVTHLEIVILYVVFDFGSEFVNFWIHGISSDMGL